MQSKRRTRIAIILGAPFTEQNFERIGIPYLSPHFEIFVFDCLGWLGRNVEEIKCKRASWSNYMIINSELDFVVAMNKHMPDYAINFIDTRIFTLGVIKIFKKNNVKLVAQKTGNLPSPSIVNRVKNLFHIMKKKHVCGIGNSGLQFEKKSISKRHSVSLINSFFNILKKVLSTNKKLYPDISLLAGNNSLNIYTKKASRIIWIGSNDYHHYNKAVLDLNAKNELKQKDDFILFIDDALPYANDWVLMKMNSPVTAEKYYPLLRNFFEKIEFQYGIPVVVAGHPNSRSDNHYFANLGGRKIVFGESASLAIQSKFVLVHGSTAVSFAVLAHKPILFITTRELDSSHYGMHVRTMANSLGSSVIFMDEIDGTTPSLLQPTINVHKYKLYEFNYLCCEHSEESAPWGNFINYIYENSN